ncbi:hypothetical protein P3T40_008066 [Paraburkholderia sp. EB58]|jgi:hypothetical protein
MAQRSNLGGSKNTRPGARGLADCAWAGVPHARLDLRRCLRKSIGKFYNRLFDNANYLAATIAGYQIGNPPLAGASLRGMLNTMSAYIPAMN